MALGYQAHSGGERLVSAVPESHAVLQGLRTMAWTADAKGRLLWCNDAMSTFCGLASPPVARSWLEFVHPDDLDRATPSWSKAVGAAADFDVDARLRRVDGEYCWHLVQARSAPAADGAIWTGSCTDISRLKKAADVLARDNEQLEQDIFHQLHEVNRTRSRLQTYFDASPEYLWLMRLTKDSGLTFEDANPAALAFLKQDQPSLAGRPPAEIIDAPAAARADKAVRECLQSGEPIQYLADVRVADDVVNVIDFVGAPLEYSNQVEGLVLLCGRDITEQRRVEDALRQSQKMEAVGQLTGGLAHDFNNLLTGITGSLDLLRARIAKGRYDAVDRYVSAAQDAAARAAALTHRLLAFSRRQTLDPKPTDANRLVVEMQELVQRTVGPEISVQVAVAADLWTVLVDPSQLENALLNLCINARDAMPKGGRIAIETKNLRLDLRIAESLDLPPGDYSSLSVTDNGTGMTPEVMARIFDPFFTTKPLGSGTGLGLSMIYGFARQSGGHVRVHSTVGVGTTMRILLPRHLGEVEALEPAHLPDEAPRAVAGETVLVVDDETTVRMLVTDVLQDLGYTALEAADGKGGIKLLNSDRRIDLLVTDVGLPGGMNGRQLADFGRAARPRLKILFITGYDENAALNHEHLEPGMQILTKPFTMDALRSRIKLLLNETP